MQVKKNLSKMESNNETDVISADNSLKIMNL